MSTKKNPPSARDLAIDSEHKVNYHILPTQVVINYGGRVLTFNRTSDEGKKVLEFIKADRVQDLPYELDPMIHIREALKEIGPEFEIIDNHVYCHGDAVDNYISRRIIDFHKEGLPFRPLLLLWQNLRKNPSKNSVEQLYRWLEKHKFPITEDGHFIAYKKVKSDYRDCHSGKFDYRIGNIVEMPRSECVDDPNNACGPGLHVGSFAYASTFSGQILLEIKVNPEFVVSVPNGCDGKCRVCRLQVVGLAFNEMTDPVMKRSLEPKAPKPSSPKPTVKTEEVSESKGGKVSVIQHVEGSVKIGNYRYVPNTVSKTTFDSAIATGEYRRSDKKDWSGIFRRPKGAKAVYVKRVSPTEFNYFEETVDSKFIRYDKVSK